MPEHDFIELSKLGYTDDDPNDLVGKIFVHIPNVFSIEECISINEIFDQYSESVGLVGKSTSGKIEYFKNSTLRDCHVTYTGRSEENIWIHDRVEQLMSSLNEKYWRCIISDFSQPMRRMKYGPDEHFNSWHPDYGIGDTCYRKLTCVVMLDDPSQYTGGDFQVAGYGTVKLNQGDAVVFPTYIYHRVTPVLTGLRRSLVHRAIGPYFK